MAFYEAIKGILSEKEAVSVLEPRCALEIKDIGCLTSKEEALEFQDLDEVRIESSSYKVKSRSAGYAEEYAEGCGNVSLEVLEVLIRAIFG